MKIAISVITAYGKDCAMCGVRGQRKGKDFNGVDEMSE